MAAPDIIGGAIDRGYSIDEIANTLAQHAGIDPAAIRGRGYDSSEILTKLGYQTPPQVPVGGKDTYATQPDTSGMKFDANGQPITAGLNTTVDRAVAAQQPTQTGQEDTQTVLAQRLASNPQAAPPTIANAKAIAQADPMSPENRELVAADNAKDFTKTTELPTADLSDISHASDMMKAAAVTVAGRGENPFTMAGIPKGAAGIANQFTMKAIDSATDGIVKQAFPDWDETNTEPQTTPQRVAAGIGMFAGFVLSPTTMASMGAPSAIKVLTRTIGDSATIDLARIVAHQSLGLGLAGTAQNIGAAVSNPDDARDILTNAAKSYAGMGAIFGAFSRLLPENTIEQFLGRAIGNNTALNLLNNTSPTDDRPLEDRVLDAAMNTFFSISGAGRMAPKADIWKIRADTLKNISDATDIDTATKAAQDGVAEHSAALDTDKSVADILRNFQKEQPIPEVIHGTGTEINDDANLIPAGLPEGGNQPEGTVASDVLDTGRGDNNEPASGGGGTQSGAEDRGLESAPAANEVERRNVSERSAMYGLAQDLAVKKGSISISMLRRQYPQFDTMTAARIIDSLENDGVVQPVNSVGRHMLSGAATAAPIGAHELNTERPGGKTAAFFTKMTLGEDGKPGATYSPTLDLSGHDRFMAEYEKHRGNFDNHIRASIPGFGDMQVKTGDAIRNSYPRGARVLDVGSSEGSWAKTITALSDGKIKTDSVDPLEAMGNHFNNISQVEGARHFTQAWGDAGWKEPNGFEVKPFKPEHKYDVVHEAMTFQFIDNNRDEQIQRAKNSMKDHGVLMLEEKFANDNTNAYAQREVQKDDYKSQYFTQKAIADKAKDTMVVGMNDSMVKQNDLEKTLQSKFKYVKQYWSSGNFGGYAASDSKLALDRLVQHIGDTNSEYSADTTPRNVEGEENAIRKSSAGRVLQREQGQAGEAGGERGRVEQGKQGTQAAEKSGTPAVGEEKHENLINVGLHVKGGEPITEAQVRAELDKIGVKVESGKVYEPQFKDDEPKFSARLSRALTPQEAHDLSATLHQEAVGQVVDGKGELYGPNAEGWRPFNPELFTTPEGGKLSERAEKPLSNMPSTVRINGRDVQFGPLKIVRDAAAAYAKEAGIKYDPPTDYVTVDKERAARIAMAYEDMQDDPTDPEVKKAYAALIKETLAQWQQIKKTGLKVEFFPGGKDTYGNPRNALLDIKDNNHLFIFPTEAGFGMGADHSENPLLVDVPGESFGGQSVTANDIFRVVHDYFGHAKEGIGFRADGEENAWRQHMAMFSPDAQRALTSETRGQNSWVNFGPHAEANRYASGEDTIYAPQKTGLLPKWVSTEGYKSKVGLHPEIVATHFSSAKREMLSGNFYGTGLVGREAKRLLFADDQRLGKRLYFYVDEGHGVEPEAGVGGVRHDVKLDNLYDATSDPLKLRASNVQTEAEANAFESAVIDHGFDGYYMKDALMVKGVRQGAAVLLGDAAHIKTDMLGEIQKSAAIKQTDTPAFKKFFAGSEVVDANGNPQVVYHATGAEKDFTSFKRSIGDVGIHFGTAGQAQDRIDFQREHINELEHTAGKPERIIPVYLHIHNPLSMNDAGRWNADNMIGQLKDIFPEDAKPYGEPINHFQQPDGSIGYRPSKINRLQSTKDIREYIQSKGYDGIVYKNTGEVAGAAEGRARLESLREDLFAKSGYSMGKTAQNAEEYEAYQCAAEDFYKWYEEHQEDSYIAFEPTQIKSAIGNTGEFNPRNKNILKTAGLDKAGYPEISEPITKEDALGALPAGMRRNAEKMIARADNGQRGGLILGTEADNMQRAAEMMAKQNGTPVADELKKIKDGLEYSKSADDARAIAGKLYKHLTPDERAKLRRDTSQKLVDIFNQLPNAKEVAAVAWAGKVKRGWYKNSANALVHVFGADSPRFAALLSSMSPKNSVEINLRNALRTWKTWTAEGRPQDRDAIVDIMGRSVEGNKLNDSVLNAWINNSVRSLTAEDPSDLVLSGPKVNSFMHNLRNNVEEVTNDAWMSNYFLLDSTLFKGNMNKSGTEPGKSPGYMAVSAKIRETAKLLSKLTGDTWTPTEVQETVWSWAKTVYEAQSQDMSATEALDSGKITDDLLSSTPDFRNQLHEARNERTLNAAGYGEQLRTLRDREDITGTTSQAERAGGETAPFDQRTQAKLERKSAARLEELRTQRLAQEAATRGEVQPKYEQDVDLADIAFSKGSNAGIDTERDQQLHRLQDKYDYSRDEALSDYFDGRRVDNKGNVTEGEPQYSRNQKISGFYHPKIGTMFVNTDKVSKQNVAGVILHEVSHAANDDRLNSEVMHRLNVAEAAGQGWLGLQKSVDTSTGAFKRWFGDSKVVDAEGKPLVVYHGSRNAGFTNFNSGTAYFSNRWDIAASYGGMDLVGEGIEYNDSNPGQYETYLKAENPMVVDWGGKDWGDGPDGLKLDDMAGRAKRLGHDGLIAENVVDTGWFNPGAVSDKGLGTVYAVFKPEQIKSATGNNGDFNPENPSILKSQTPSDSESTFAQQRAHTPEVEGIQKSGTKIDQTKTPEFLKWSKGAEVVLLSDSQDHPFKSEEPVVVEALHGTTGDFTSFDKSFANPEADLGAGFYFTNTPEDASYNYAGRGPDLTHKLQLLAERIASYTDRDYSDPEVIMEAEQKLYVQHGGMALPVFVKFQRPLVIGGRGETRFELTEAYNERTDTYGHPGGNLVKVLNAVKKIKGEYDDFTPEEVIASIYHEAADKGGELSPEELIQAMVNSPGMLYATDRSGSSVGNDLARQILELAGFDGIIDQTVNKKFGSEKRVGKPMKGMNEGTTHFIAFKPTQIKSSIGNSGKFSSRNQSILKSVAPTFYSALERTIPDMKKIAAKDGTINVEQAKRWLAARQAEGKFKAAEAEAIGLNDWLKLQDGKVPVKDIEQFVKDNGVQVEDVTLRGEQGHAAAGRSTQRDENGTYSVYDRYGDKLNDDFSTERDAIDWSDEDVRDTVGHDVTGATKFSDYQLPGGENYKELLLTLPFKNAEIKWKITDLPDGQVIVTTPKGLERTWPNRDAANAWIKTTGAQERANEAAGVFTSRHFDQPNILAHVRFNERTVPVHADASVADIGSRILKAVPTAKSVESLANGAPMMAVRKGLITEAEAGKYAASRGFINQDFPTHEKVLFLEELQSDWGQKGKKEGFRSSERLTPAESDRLRELTTRRQRAPADGLQGQDLRDYITLLNKNTAYNTGLPSAPFVTDTKAWTALALKRMIRYAVDNGMDKVAWTTGEQQAERYELSKQITRVEYIPETKTLRAFDRNTGHAAIDKSGIEENQIEDYVGKEVAKNLLESKPRTTGSGKNVLSVEGEGLRVGGEGMKGFYDQIVPQVANDILKKLGGGKVDDIEIDVQGSPETKTGLQQQRGYVGPEVSPEEIRTLLANGEFSAGIESQLRNIYDARKQGISTADAVKQHGSISSAEAIGGEYRALRNVWEKQQSFTITPKMREMVMQNGMPLFSKGAAAEGDIYSRVRARMDAAGSAGDAREATSYLVEEAMTMGREAGHSRLDTPFWDWATKALPKFVVDTLKTWVANVRAAMFRHGLLKTQDLTVDDFVAVARANMRGLAEGKIEPSGGEGPMAGEALQPSKQKLVKRGAPVIQPPNLLQKAGSIASSIYSGLKDLQDAYLKTPEFTESKRIIGKYTGDLQEIELNLTKIAKQINLRIPKDRQIAITNYLQAGGDMSILRERADRSFPEYRDGYEAAMHLNPEELKTAKFIEAQQNEFWQKAHDAGILEGYVENYVRGQWQKENPQGERVMAIVGSGMLNDKPREAMKKVFQNYFEGEQLGYVPEDKRIGYQFVAAQRSIRGAIAARQALVDLMHSTEADGRPTVAVGGGGTMIKEDNPDLPYFVKPNIQPKDSDGYRLIDHSALRKWKWVGSDDNGKPIMMQGQMYIHPDAYGKLNALLGKSLVRTFMIPKHVPIIGGTQPGDAALRAGAFVKSTIMIGPFHQFHLGEHAIFHGVNPMDAPEINFDTRPILREGVQHGLMLYAHKAMAEFAEGLQSGGLLHQLPIAGEHLQQYQEWLFQDYIPRLKASMFEKAVARAEVYYAKELKSGKLTRDQLLDNTAKQANAAFGELNYKYMGRNPTYQDILRLTLLAPDFLEARFKFFGQAMRPHGKEQAMALVRGALIMGAAAQTVNMMFGDQEDKTITPADKWTAKAIADRMHLDKPFSAIIDGREYSPRSVVADIYHLVTDPRGFWYNRINPLWGKPVLELATGKNQNGQMESFKDGVKNILKGFMPIPVQGAIRNNQGQTRMQSLLSTMLQSIGITNYQSHTSAEKEIGNIAFGHRTLAGESDRQQQHYDSYEMLKNDYMDGTLNSMDDVKAKARESDIVLTKGMALSIMRSRDTSPQGRVITNEHKMGRFNSDELLQVWNKMDTQEHAAYKSFMLSRLAKSSTLIGKEKLDAIRYVQGAK